MCIPNIITLTFCAMILCEASQANHKFRVDTVRRHWAMSICCTMLRLVSAKPLSGSAQVKRICPYLLRFIPA
ncbi:uncharacterized protein BO88DRAFT_403301 [Aspergillus vadensis CBS 113365]|uniref:Secreted protein n=1 Tax=Aspergillus vadensis (strain CBS 113365 / IMI 142717 / IBT 24658) TaxID=1448311 RepID=A0A319BG12_ASPVC|nr:hypothetical protein BO88DRAFT_403301 [Aspergillus vadensis CBS 113365]PYH71121.1 hypothetical protein BO88DRAFT_403301 [Aspergillus vadensis CBS 113365]